jgi:membrane protein DedA with SNARE-associated domain
MKVFPNRIQLLVENFLQQYGYIALLIGSFLEGESALLIASSLIHRGVFYFPFTVLAAFGGSFISDWVYYLVGRWNGKYFVKKRPKLQDRVKPVTDFFHRHRLAILLSYRFLYGFRIVIPLVIGMSGLAPATYLFYSILNGIIWATIVTSAGYGIGLLLDLTVQSVENNLLLVIAGFGCFGLTLGYIIKRITTRKMIYE